MARTVDQEQHRKRRAAVTAAATELFARQGFADTTTAQIARAAGISTGSLFYYFPDKPAIFRAIFEADIPTSRALFEKYAEPDDPAAAILDVVGALAAPARDGHAPGLVIELLRQAGNDPQLTDIVSTNEAIVQDGLASLIRRAGAVGQVDPELDPDAAAAWIRTIVDATYLDSRGADPLGMLRLTVARLLVMDGAPPAGPA